VERVNHFKPSLFLFLLGGGHLTDENILTRLKTRIPDIDDAIATELVQTAKDRISLRVGLKNDAELPKELESIVVEVVTAMYNRYQMNHEGVLEERVDVFSVKFVNNLLDQYKEELEEIKQKLADDEDSTRRKVRFL